MKFEDKGGEVVSGTLELDALDVDDGLPSGIVKLDLPNMLWDTGEILIS